MKEPTTLSAELADRAAGTKLDQGRGISPPGFGTEYSVRAARPFPFADRPAVIAAMPPFYAMAAAEFPLSKAGSVAKKTLERIFAQEAAELERIHAVQTARVHGEYLKRIEAASDRAAAGDPTRDGAKAESELALEFEGETAIRTENLRRLAYSEIEPSFVLGEAIADVLGRMVAKLEAADVTACQRFRVPLTWSMPTLVGQSCALLWEALSHDLRVRMAKLRAKAVVSPFAKSLFGQILEWE